MSKLVEIAVAELGTKESPPNSNQVKYNTWYYGREVSGSAYPWCMVFVQWCCDQAGITPPIRTASCGTLLNAARAAGEAVYTDFQPGDIVIYDFQRDGTTDHCGIVESASGATVTAIEGNTAVGNDSDGGEVMRRTRNIYQIVGAWRPKEDTMTYEDFKGFMDQYRAELQDNDCGSWSQEARDWAVATGLITGSGTTPDGQPNYMWRDQLTREQKVVMDKRLYDKISEEIQNLRNDIMGEMQAMHDKIMADVKAMMNK